MELFVLGRRAPTTRDVANLVKEGGAAALTDAEHLADGADYQEVTCRSALNAVRGMPFSWTLNPYRGCTHGCHYCFARRYHTQFEMNAGDEFASVILVKTNLVEVLTRELDRPSWDRSLVAIGTATDPYQPIEGRYRLTRASLAVMARARTPAGIVTKGPMVVRDRDVLGDLSRAARCTVYVSVPTVELVDAGIDAGVLMAPVVPGFTSSRSKIECTIKAIADHGARFVGYNVMHLEDGTRNHFLKFIAQEFPAMLPRFERLYAQKHPPVAYRREVQAMVRVLQDRYGLSKRENRPAADVAVEPVEPQQVAFAW